MMRDDLRHTHQPGSRTVLIVEDEEPIALAIGVIVEELGYNPLYASNGREGLELANEREVALIVSDLMMPRMNGWQFLTQLREERERAGRPMPPLIIMSAMDARQSQGLHADAVLTKPFDIVVVERLLLRYLEEQPQPQGQPHTR